MAEETNLLSYDEAMELAKTVRWKTETCGQGEKCWCRLIVPEETIVHSEDENFYICGDGEINKELAEHIVEVHNHYLETNGKI